MRSGRSLSRFAGVLGAVLAAALVLSACSSTTVSRPAAHSRVSNGGTLSIGIPTAPSALDPTT